MTRSRALLACALSALLVASACSGDDSDEGAKGAGHATAVLTAVADNLIIPGYEALTRDLGNLGGTIGILCTSADEGSLGTAREAWRSAQVAWGNTRAAMVGPASDRRLMSAVGARARATSIEALVAGTDPVDADALADAGTTVRGIYAVEVALFAPEAAALTTPTGARRCAYAAAATVLAQKAVGQVLDDWVGDTDYRATFIHGPDGDQQTTLNDLVNDLNFRLTEIDDQGLHDLVGVTDPAAVPDNRADGPAAQRLAYLKAMYQEAAGLLTGTTGGSIVSLLEKRSPDTSERLTALVDQATTAMAALPDSVTAALADQTALSAADDAVSQLRVLVSTEAASQLGVTIGFSDSDGDS